MFEHRYATKNTYTKGCDEVLNKHSNAMPKQIRVKLFGKIIICFCSNYSVWVWESASF